MDILTFQVIKLQTSVFFEIFQRYILLVFTELKELLKSLEGEGVVLLLDNTIL